MSLPNTSTVDVEFSIWYPVLNEGKSFDGNVQSLMPLKAARKDDDQFSIGACARPTIENGRIDVVDKNRAFLGGNRSGYQFLMPDMVGHNHMIHKRRGCFLNHL